MTCLASLVTEGLGANQYIFGAGSEAYRDEGFAAMRYYQKLYGEAFIDLMERGLERMTEEDPGTLIGISSPGCTVQYNANGGYDLPGSGKCIMEYSMRLFALRAAKKRCSVNVVIPGVTETEGWGKLAATRGADRDEMVKRISDRIVPMEKVRRRTFLTRPAGDGPP